MQPDVVHQHDPEPVTENDLLSHDDDQSVSHAFNMLTHTSSPRTAGRWKTS